MLLLGSARVLGGEAHGDRQIVPIGLQRAWEIVLRDQQVADLVMATEIALPPALSGRP